MFPTSNWPSYFLWTFWIFVIIFLLTRRSIFILTGVILLPVYYYVDSIFFRINPRDYETGVALAQLSAFLMAILIVVLRRMSTSPERMQGR